jgi:hypothetical protein
MPASLRDLGDGQRRVALEDLQDPNVRRIEKTFFAHITLWGTILPLLRKFPAG